MITKSELLKAYSDISKEIEREKHRNQEALNKLYRDQRIAELRLELFTLTEEKKNDNDNIC